MPWRQPDHIIIGEIVDIITFLYFFYVIEIYLRSRIASIIFILRKYKRTQRQYLFIEEKDLRSSVAVWMKLLVKKIM